MNPRSGLPSVGWCSFWGPADCIASTRTLEKGPWGRQAGPCLPDSGIVHLGWTLPRDAELEHPPVLSTGGWQAHARQWPWTLPACLWDSDRGLVGPRVHGCPAGPLAQAQGLSRGVSLVGMGCAPGTPSTGRHGASRLAWLGPWGIFPTRPCRQPAAGCWSRWSAAVGCCLEPGSPRTRPSRGSSFTATCRGRASLTWRSTLPSSPKKVGAGAAGTAGNTVTTGQPVAERSVSALRSRFFRIPFPSICSFENRVN